jgi:hypothetical protein
MKLFLVNACGASLIFGNEEGWKKTISKKARSKWNAESRQKDPDS